jgi:hypothetical protein
LRFHVSFIRMDGSGCTRWLPEKLRARKTGTGCFVAEAGRYTRRFAVGPSLASVKWIAICLRIAVPASARAPLSTTSKRIAAGGAGLRP